jgi:uncharacterized phage protein gp47/JayE
MPIDELPGKIEVPDRDRIREDWLRDYRFHGPDGVSTVDGTLPFLEASVFADSAVGVWSAVQTTGNNLVLTEATGTALEQWATSSGLDGRTAPIGSTGYVVADASAGGTTIFVGDELKDTAGLRYQCTVTDTYYDGGLIPVAGIDTGPGTNQEPDVVLTWTAPRPGCGPTASVWTSADGDGLTGGRDEETDGELLERIITTRANPAASGNDAEYQQAVKKTPGLPIQAAFTVPAILGPGTIAVTATMQPDAPGGSRLPTTAQLAAIEAYVKDQFPADDGLFVCSLIGQNVDVALEVAWQTGANDWADVAPWPPYYASTDAITVQSATSPTVFILERASANYAGVTQPIVGQTFALYDNAAAKFRRKRILSFTGTGPWTITVDTDNAASDTTYTPVAGQAASPYSASMDLVVAPILAYFNGLGPGEQVSTFFDPGLRQRRSPASPGSWPNTIGYKLINGVQDVAAVNDANLLSPSIPTTTTVGTPGVSSYLLQLRYIAVYELLPMASTDTLTWDESPPRRPGLDDVGGGQKVNGIPAPDPVRMLTAEDVNQFSAQIAGMGRVVAACKISVRFSAGAPVLYKFSAPGSDVVSGTFTLTDNGTGDTSIEWPANTFPTLVVEGEATVNGATPAMIAVETISNGVRVRTEDDTGTAVDVAFTVTVN